MKEIKFKEKQERWGYNKKILSIKPLTLTVEMKFQAKAV